ncbi:hypothetical protein RN001_007587 [Aquatica leii]|uniref:MADF domain-containing protein n=1 Tax=Aquatica leii TaxID=1421715 RepID=A0AAN7PDB7_9COLE|nr:hypothetical protein RN001_007587 [Aquatica leii]
MKLYKEEENLWNTFDPNYKNRDLRNASLQHIAKKIKLEKINVPDEQNLIKDAMDELKQLINSLAKPASLEQEDECELIGKHIVYQLRLLPLLDMMDARNQIQQILSAYRKNTYSTTTPLCSPLDTAFSQLSEFSIVLHGEPAQSPFSQPSTSNSNQNTSSLDLIQQAMSYTDL